MIGVGVIGYGYWGPNLVRNFHEARDSHVVAVADLDAKRLEPIRARYPTIETVTEPSQLLRDPRIDAIAIATPVSTHFDLAMQAIRENKHVLVEKPITESSEQAVQLIEEADRRNLVLMVDHTFIYTGAVRKIRELVLAKALGEIYYYDSVRINLGLFQRDVNVLWDLAVHDLSVMDYVLPYPCCAVSATGMSHVPGQPEDTAYLTLFFQSNRIGHVHVSWLSPVKLRRTLVGGSQKMVVYNDLHPDEVIKVYDKGVTVNNDREDVYRMLVEYRTGDMLVPQIDRTEALKTEVAHFNDCVIKGQRPITSGETGLSIVRILEAGTESMKNRGHPVELSDRA